MSEFETWLHSVRAEPEAWLGPIIRSDKPDLALELIRDNPHLLHMRLGGNDTPLLVAAYSGHHELAKRLLAMGAKMDLFAAIALGHTGAVRGMLNEDPRLLHKHSPDGWTVLHIAARYADTEMLTLLVSAGADVNDNRNKKWKTPLFFATEEPYSNAVLLLANGAEIDARARHGFTVLHFAAKWGYAAFVEFLLAHGARSDIQTDARQTAWALAVRNGHQRVAAVLSSR
jgi:ankyrin repeat protein